jgi:AhpD family alkylhydroperoxidase
MTRITPVGHATAAGRTKDLFDAVKARLGLVPNMTRAMAVCPAVLDAYLGMSGALGNGDLPAEVREPLARGVAEVNHRDYCLSAHTAIGKHAGLTPADILASRRGGASDPRTNALRRFAQAVVAKQGRVEDADVAAGRAAGPATPRSPRWWPTSH